MRRSSASGGSTRREPTLGEIVERRGHPQRTPAPGTNAHAALERVRSICAALAESFEKEAWGEPTFRSPGGMFAMFVNDHHGDGRVAVWCKAAWGVQEMLVANDPERFFVPPYVGTKGWIGVRVDRKVDWDELAQLLGEAHGLGRPSRSSSAGTDPSRSARRRAVAPIERPLADDDLPAKHPRRRARPRP